MTDDSRLDVLGQAPVEDWGEVDEWALRQIQLLTPEERVERMMGMAEFVAELKLAGERLHGKVDEAIAAERISPPFGPK